MVENILKEEKFKINLSRNVPLHHIIDTVKIFEHHFESSDLKINGFIVSKKGQFFIIKKGRFFYEDRVSELFTLILKYEHIAVKYKSLFLKLNSKESVAIKNKKELILFLYFDVVLLLEIAARKQQLELDNQEEKEKIKMSLGANIEFSNIKKKRNPKKYIRSNLTQRATNAHFWNKELHSKNISFALLDVSKAIGANEIEFPFKYDENKLLILLNDFNNMLNQLNIQSRNFEIRFKKIAHYKKTGMYIKNAQCFIIDPRFSTSLYHELGHFLYETNEHFVLNGINYDENKMKEIIDNQKEHYIEKMMNHRIENLNENSEVFAYWFEDQIKHLFFNKNS